MNCQECHKACGPVARGDKYAMQLAKHVEIDFYTLDDLLWKAKQQVCEWAEAEYRKLCFDHRKQCDMVEKYMDLRQATDALEQVRKAFSQCFEPCLPKLKILKLVEHVKGLIGIDCSKKHRRDFCYEDLPEDEWIIAAPYCANYREYDRLKYISCEYICVNPVVTKQPDCLLEAAVSINKKNCDIDIMSTVDKNSCDITHLVDVKKFDCEIEANVDVTNKRCDIYVEADVRKKICDLVVAAKVENKLCELLPTIQTYKHQCQIGAKVTMSTDQCELSYNALIKKYNCDISLKSYIYAVQRCNISPTVIQHIYECDYHLIVNTSKCEAHIETDQHIISLNQAFGNVYVPEPGMSVEKVNQLFNLELDAEKLLQVRTKIDGEYA